jgi:hypothetical protein
MAGASKNNSQLPPMIRSLFTPMANGRIRKEEVYYGNIFSFPFIHGSFVYDATDNEMAEIVNRMWRKGVVVQ